MSHLTRSRTIAFAEQMTRLVLTKPRLYTELGLNKVWDHWDVKVLEAQPGVVILTIRVRGFSKLVHATCHVLIGRDDRPDEGQCRIVLKGKDPHNDAYWCMCVDDQLRYLGPSHGIAEKDFHLDEDLLADLNAGGITTRLELQMLSEYEVCSLLRPRPDTDPYVLTHPDPARYAERQMLEKFRRLAPALKAMGVELHGSPLSSEDLAALIP